MPPVMEELRVGALAGERYISRRCTSCDCFLSGKTDRISPLTTFHRDLLPLSFLSDRSFCQHGTSPHRPRRRIRGNRQLDRRWPA